MLFQSFCVLALAYGQQTYATYGYNSLEAVFGPHVSPQTEIAESSDANFSAIVGPRWSAWETPRWSGAIKPATISDLQKVVQIASRRNIPFIATNGGHGARAGLGEFDGFNINLQRLNNVKVDAAKNRMTLGPGASLGEMVTAVFAAGKEIQTGNSWCPGAVGVTLGGGIGMLMGKHGLMIDSLKSAQLLTSTGEIVTASESKNPDLFWGLRGAGQNFGIVTEATYEIHDLTNNGIVTATNFFYQPSANRSLWEVIKSYDDTLPPELSLQVGMLYNSTTKTPTLWLATWYIGSLKDAKPHLDKFAALKPVSTQSLNLTQPQVYFQSVERGVCDRGHSLDAYTVGLGRTDVATLETHFGDFVALHEANGGKYAGQSYIQWYSNKANLRTPSEKTSFPWRDVKAWWLLENIWVEDSQLPAITKWSEEQRDSFQATSGFKEEHIYVNYALGDEGAAAWYSKRNLPKLRWLKAKWDPKNLFGKGYLSDI